MTKRVTFPAGKIEAGRAHIVVGVKTSKTVSDLEGPTSEQQAYAVMMLAMMSPQDFEEAMRQVQNSEAHLLRQRLTYPG